MPKPRGSLSSLSGTLPQTRHRLSLSSFRRVTKALVTPVAGTVLPCANPRFDEGILETESFSNTFDIQSDSGYGSLYTTPDKSNTCALQPMYWKENTGRDQPQQQAEYPPSLFEDNAHLPPSSGGAQSNLGIEKVLTLESVNRDRGACPDEAIGTVYQRNETPPKTNPIDSDHRPASDRSSTGSPMRESDSAISREASPESNSSGDTSRMSPENDALLAMSLAKHRMMVSLMRDVYSIFDPQWRAECRSRTGSQAADTSAYSQASSSRTSSSIRRGKRRMDDRDSDPPDGDDKKKRKKDSPKSGDGGQGRLFACCFYKYNSQKYCSNSDTGTKYRSCAGPGFSRISQLKQHLKRNHPAPIYCPRCWLVMDSQTEMALHANTEERCERKEPQVQEGVDQDKMHLITETWGASWEGIYEILFPGAPVPSPYYEADKPLPEDPERSSPRSQDLRDFEAYNRATLPLLVEANLRALVETQIAPIEEYVRAMVVDIVRSCQTTVARNFRLTIAPTLLANDRTHSYFQTVTSVEHDMQTHEDPAQISTHDTAGNSEDFYMEPPHLNTEASASSQNALHEYNGFMGSQNQNSDSGYGSLPRPFACSCSCHEHSNNRDTANRHSGCQSCTSMHVCLDDFNDLDLDTLYNDFD